VTTKCKYSCSLCGIHRNEVEVKSRQNEEVTDWMDKVLISTLIADHEARSPGCHPDAFAQVMIPVTGTDRIGGSVLN
jgi:hypothetical protein